MSKKILSPLRRDGYKAGMIMMLIALSTMLLTTACSSEDDLVNNTANTENTINKGYALPVTVNVTREGDATTRATYTDNGNGTGSLAFSAGDKLFVFSYNGGSAGMYAGVLDWVSDGTFSGTIYTQNSYEGTIDALLSGGDPAAAALLPAGYGDYGYLSTEGNSGSYSDGYTEDYTKAFVASTTEKTAKALAVEQFSFESATYESGGFALEPNNAILNFTITGLAASTNVAVSLTSYAYNITGTVTTDSSGNATFAMGIKSAIEINPLTLTVGGKKITITSTNTVFNAGKIYNISRSAASVPEGAISGQFSVSSTKKVYFSKGNLQLSAANTWKFADNQWDYFGDSQYDNHRDLFGWGTGNNPNQTSKNNGDYSSFTDWGTAAASSIGSGWRTLTGGSDGEWEYLFGTNPYYKRTTTSGLYFAKATVNGLPGVILLPDDWSTSYYTLNSTNSTEAAYDTNTISESDWSSKLESHGCVFLPAAGYREGTSVRFVGDYGGYWSSTAHNDDTDYAHDAYFDSGNVGPDYAYERYYGCSVRLVRDVQ